MYLQKAIFKNISPFGDLDLEFENNQVVCFSSLNGKGKTTILSYIADSFFEFARAAQYSDVFTDKTKYYRVISPLIIKPGEHYSLVYLRFVYLDSHYDYIEITGEISLEEYENIVNIPDKVEYSKLEGAKSVKHLEVTEEKAKDLFQKNVMTFFPADRTETAVWYNDSVLVDRSFSVKSKFTTQLKKNIEAKSVSYEVANWILDVILDDEINDHPAYDNKLISSLNSILSLVMRSKVDNARFGISKRNNSASRLAIIGKPTSGVEYMLSPSIFHLSSGETALLMMFVEILKQYDSQSSTMPTLDLNKVTGVVIIDEIEKHLHIKLQKEELPKLIELFPSLQLIVSSNSPFFTIGCAEVLQNRFRLIDIASGIDLPSGNVEEWDEVEKMVLAEQENYKLLYDNLNSSNAETKKIRIVTEGHNTKYIQKAVELFCPNLLDDIYICEDIASVTGKQQMKNAYSVLSSNGFKNKTLFVWDCDAETIVDALDENEYIYKFVFEKNTANTKATCGIENLFSKTQFKSSVYTMSIKPGSYGGVSKIKSFDKSLFMDKVLASNSKQIYKNFKPLIEKITSII